MIYSQLLTHKLFLVYFFFGLAVFALTLLPAAPSGSVSLSSRFRFSFDSFDSFDSLGSFGSFGSFDSLDFLRGCCSP
jgi:hypothetical protein